MSGNPFRFSETAEKESFCSRSEELATLSGLMASGENCILLSQHKWGKSSLLVNALSEVITRNHRLTGVYFDLHHDIREHQFYQGHANACMKAAAKDQQEYMNLAALAFDKLRPEINFNLQGEGSLSMGFDWEALELHKDEVLQLPERLAELTKRNLLIGLDSFDKIVGIDDPLIFLRNMHKIAKKQKRVTYYLAANAYHPFRSWVSEPSGPLYQFGETLFLHPIPDADWVKFIVHQFSGTDKYISEQNALEIVRLASSHPGYVQWLAHEVWNLAERRVSAALLPLAVENIISRNDSTYRNMVHNMSKSRLSLLHYLCTNPLQKPTVTTMESYDNPNEQKLRRIIRFFEKREILFSYKGNLHFNDALFPLWLRKRLF